MIKVLLSTLMVAAASSLPDPYSRPSEDLFNEPGETWVHDAFTHGEDLRLLDSGVYVMRSYCDVCTASRYEPGIWTRNADHIVLTFPAATKPVLELNQMIYNGCTVLMPVLPDRPHALSSQRAFKRKQDSCPHLLDSD